MNNKLTWQISSLRGHTATSINLSILLDILWTSLLYLLTTVQNYLTGDARIVLQENIGWIYNCLWLLFGYISFNQSNANLLLYFDWIVSLPLYTFQVLSWYSCFQVLRSLNWHVWLLITLDKATKAAWSCTKIVGVLQLLRYILISLLIKRIFLNDTNGWNRVCLLYFLCHMLIAFATLLSHWF